MNIQKGLGIQSFCFRGFKDNAVAMAETFSDRLYGVRFKDFIFQRNREPEDVVVGTGNLDLPGLVEVMEKADFDEHGVLEYEGDVDNPVPALADCITEINKTSIGT